MGDSLKDDPMRVMAPLLILTMALGGCARLGDSAARLNPLRWFADDAPTTLEPKSGYTRAATDARPGIAAVTGVRWEPLNEGRMLVVTGMAPTKGYWRAGLVAETPDPTGRLRPDAEGILRLRFVAIPPRPGDTAARMPANEATDTITAAVTLPATTLVRVRQVVITGAGNAVTLAR